MSPEHSGTPIPNPHEHQPEVEALHDTMRIVDDLPAPNEPAEEGLDRQEDLRLAREVSQQIDQLRTDQQRYANFWYQHQQYQRDPAAFRRAHGFTNGQTGNPYIDGVPVFSSDNPREPQQVLRGAEAHEYMRASLGMERQTIVNTLGAHLREGDGRRLLGRLQEDAYRVAPGSASHTRLSETVARNTAAVARNEESSQRADHALLEAARGGARLSSPGTVTSGVRKEDLPRQETRRPLRYLGLRRRPAVDDHGNPVMTGGTDEVLTELDAAGRLANSTAARRALTHGRGLYGPEPNGSHTRAAELGNDQARLMGYTDPETGEEYLESFHSLLTGIINEAASQRQETFDNIDSRLDNAETTLNNWPLTDPTPDPDQGAAVDDLIREATEILDDPNSISRRDSDRPERLDRLNRLRFRRLQRDITTAAANNVDEATYNAFYTDGGGIYINTPEGPRVIYEDGSTSRQEDGNFVRRWGNGQAWTTPPEPQIRDAFYDQVAAIESRDELETLRDEAFATWERLRRPDDRLRAAGYMEEYAGRLDHEAVALQERQTNMEAEWQDLQAIDEPNDEQRGRITELMTSIRDVIGERQILHTEINVNRYWQGVLTAENVPPAGPARIGRIAMSGAVEPTPPHVLANGTLIWNVPGEDDRLHSWEIRPNGTATLRATS